jgi:hypothetical protein
MLCGLVLNWGQRACAVRAALSGATKACDITLVEKTIPRLNSAGTPQAQRPYQRTFDLWLS